VEQVRLGGAAVLQRLDQPRPARVRRRLLLGDAAFVDEGLDERVVAREPVQLALAQQVGAGVAQVQDPDPGAVDQERDDGGARAAQVRVLLGERREPGRRLVDGVAQCGEQVDSGEVDAAQLGVQVAHGRDRDRARDLPVGVPAHPVRHGQYPRARDGRVLVVLPATAHVGADRGAQRRSHGVTLSCCEPASQLRGA
jgi:hypothetical protein